MVNHYDELVKQVNYQLSVRHLTTSTLVGQLSQFQTALLSSNFAKSEQANIRVIVDEIWSTYDLDNCGELCKNEARLLVKEYLPVIEPNFKYSDGGFERVFAEIDAD
jgi:hypothetical protein